MQEQPPKKNQEEYRISPEVKEIITNARELASDLGHSWVSAEHIFLAIFKDTEVIPREILLFLGVDVQFVTTKILEYLCDNEGGSKNSDISDGTV